MAVANQVDTAFRAGAINHNADNVAVHHLSNRATRQRFRADVSEAGASGNTRETGIGKQGHLLPERQMFERTRDLVGVSYLRD